MNDEISRINGHHRHRPFGAWPRGDSDGPSDNIDDVQAMAWRVLLAACCDKDATGLAIPLNIQDLRFSEPLVAVAEMR